MRKGKQMSLLGKQKSGSGPDKGQIDDPPSWREVHNGHQWGFDSLSRFDV